MNIITRMKVCKEIIHSYFKKYELEAVKNENEAKIKELEENN